MENEIRTRGHSERDLSVDSLRFYEDYWQEAKDISATTDSKNRAVLKHFFPGKLKDKRILEIGVGGEGGIILSLKNENRVYGIDVSSSAQKNCERLGLKIDLVNVDTQGVPFENDYFDIVFAFEVFEHFANPQFVVEEIRRVLKNNGNFLLSTPNPFIHHWPRLFYPGLFEEQAFREFLMINEFKIKSKNNLGVNMYQHICKDPSAKAFMWFWNCEKIDKDPDMCFDYGLYFWDQRNHDGIKTRPIEAIDMFRKSLELGGQENIKARFFLTLSLLYRYVYKETEEFMKHAEWFMDKANGDQYPLNMKSVFVSLLLNLEMKKFGFEIIDGESYKTILQGLQNFPGSETCIDIINNLKSAPPDYGSIVRFLE
ncbi:MAG: class I SAM-dependent methyltransferase [Deltaproteobacteria bacterium]|nr:class I SAM-dependent methyltransferase [Deltaproteobacteria bacterium]